MRMHFRRNETHIGKYALSVVAMILTVQAVTGEVGSLRVDLVNPKSGDYVAGPITVHADVIGGTGTAKVSFYFDGRLAFVDPAPPYEYQWDAGPTPRVRTIMVVATDDDGHTARASKRTAGVDSTETVDVKLRQISVTALDGKGNFVKDLEAANFEVFEDGTRRQATHFYKGDAALSLAMLLDVSKSMLTGLRIEKSKKAACEFLNSLRPMDHVMAIAFNNGVYSFGDFTTDRASLTPRIESLVAGGGTALYDTLIAATRKLNERPGRKVIVVFSDGRDEHSVASLGDATDALLRGDTTVYAVGLGLLNIEEKQRDILEDWARQTGGRAFFTNDVNEVGKFYAAIAEELRWQYSLGYPPPPSKRSWHEIKIDTVGRQGVRLRYRTGYLND